MLAQGIESLIENCKKEVQQINKLTLERTIVRYPSAFEDDKVQFPSYQDVSESMSYIYKDNNGNIRKFLTMFNHVELSGYTVHYFDAIGKIVYSHIYSRSYMTPHFYGYRYMYEGKQVFCDMDVYDEDKDSWERITYNWGEILSSYYNSFDKILHADSILSFCESSYNVQDIFIADLTDKICFVPPAKGTKTIINAKRVNIREKDTVNSSSILTPLFGEIVEILEKGKEENIAPYGMHNWYKVVVNDKTGYIYGAFLEPIEREAEE